MYQTWSQTLVSQQAQGSLFNNFTTAKTVLSPQAIIDLSAGFLQNLGQKLTINVKGAISNIVTTPGTIVFQVMLGAVIAFTTGVIQLNATAHTLLPFSLDIDLILRAVGSGTTAKFQGMGVISGLMFTLTAGQADSAQGHQTIQVPQTAPALGTGFDSTAAQTLDLFAGFSIANAGNGVQIEQYTVSSPN